MPPKQQNRVKKYAIIVIKILIAGLLIYFLVVNGRFDFQRQLTALQQPLLIIWLFIIWGFSFVLLVAWRWQRISKIFNLNLPFLFAAKTHATGIFISTWLPGGIGGDIWKAYLFGRQHTLSTEKHLAYLTVFVDRALGLYAIICCGAIAVLLNLDEWLALDYAYLPILLVGLWLFISLIGLFIIVVPLSFPETLLTPYRKIESRWPFFATIAKTIKLTRDNKQHLASGLTLSIFIQLLNILFFVVITQAITSQGIEFQLMAAIFAIGLLTTILPIAPGGIGVGHFVFDLLFNGFGLMGGADVFNFFLITTTLFSLVGVIPFLFSQDNFAQIRSHLPVSTGNPTTTQ